MNQSIQRKIISVLLAVIFLFGGISFIIAEDADKNGKIDLKDAVLNVQKNHFETRGQVSVSTIETCLSTLEAVAGIQHLSTSTSIDKDGFSFLNWCFLTSKADLLYILAPSENVLYPLSNFDSINLSPPVFPPVRS